MKQLTLVLIALSFATAAEAKQYRRLTRIVNENVTAVSDAMNKTADDETLMLEGGFELKRLYIRVQAKAGFDVEFGKLELIPEIELVFQKEKI